MYSVQKIHNQALVCAKRFLQNQVELIDILSQVIQHKVYEHLGFSSVFEYCTLGLKLSSDQACSFIGIARKSIEVPEIKLLVQDGELSISNARRIVPHIRNDNKEFWLEKATSLSQRELEKEIVKLHPAAKVVERIKPVAENLSSLLILIDDEDAALWNRLTEVMLQKFGRKVEKREVLRAAMTALLDKEDPLRIAERIERKKENMQRVLRGKKVRELSEVVTEELNPKATEEKPGARVPSAAKSGNFTRSSIPAAVLRQVNLRDQGRCTHVENGVRCSCRVFLQVHHRLPMAFGGSHTLENLVTLCSTHHRYVHQFLRGEVSPGARRQM